MNLLKRMLLKWRGGTPAPVPVTTSSAVAPTRSRHESWCDTGMPSADYWASVGMPIRCNCNDTGPGSFRAVMAAFDTFRDVDRRAQRIIGVDLGVLPDAETLAREGANGRGVGS